MNEKSELLQLLCCPTCKGPLEEHAEGLACAACQVVYPIVGQVPRLLPEEAKALKT